MTDLQESLDYPDPFIFNAPAWARDFDTDALRSIQALARALAHNFTHGSPWNYTSIPIVEKSRRQHKDDAWTIESWTYVQYAENGGISQHGLEVCARLWHQMAAREAAFRLAGLELV